MIDESVDTTRAAQMQRALALAERGWGRVSPNPMVGALVVDDRTGSVVGEGWHEGPGTRHAEVMALEQAGGRAHGSTVVCTLEPCTRYGRTPPCTLALVRAGVAKVVLAATDPNLGEQAPGAAELRDAGIEVEIGLLEAESRRLNRAFERSTRMGRPSVTLKLASTLDGKTAANDGSSRWITSEAARADVQRLRAWSDAVVVGAGTAIADDPALTVRDPRVSEAMPPLRVVVDATGRVPARGRLFDGGAPTLMVTTEAASGSAIDGWAAAGAEVLALDGDGRGGVSLPALVETLGKRDAQGVLIEGGATLAWSFVRDDLIDDLVVYVAPKVVGGLAAPGLVAGEGFSPIANALDLTFGPSQMLGPDIRLEAHVHRDR